LLGEGIGVRSSHQFGGLILRLILGVTFFVHGVVKFRDGIGNVSAWFNSIGIPDYMAYVVALIELIGGLALIFGIGTRIVSALLAFVLLVATLKVKLDVGFLGNGQMAGYELDLSMLGIAVYLLLNGSSLLSVDSLVRKESKA
jgi:putative oxidoreductase